MERNWFSLDMTYLLANFSADFYVRLLKESNQEKKTLALNGMSEIYDDLENGKVALKARFPSQKRALIKSIKIVIPGTTASTYKQDRKAERTDHTKNHLREAIGAYLILSINLSSASKESYSSMTLNFPF